MTSAFGAGPCVFCRIVAGDAPASVIVEEPLVVAFLDIQQAGDLPHVLVVPRNHVECLTEVQDAVATRMMLLGQEVAGAVRALPGCAGVTLHLADGWAAGQRVPHAHLHVIGRSVGDGLRLQAPWRKPGRCVLEGFADALRQRLPAR